MQDDMACNLTDDLGDDSTFMMGDNDVGMNDWTKMMRWTMTGVLSRSPESGAICLKHRRSLRIAMRMCDNHTSEKEIVRFTSENARKRHLPPWMLPKVGAATNPVGNSDNGEKNCTSEKEASAEAPPVTENAGIALKKKEGKSHKREPSRRKSYSLSECEVKRRRKLSKQEASSDNNATQKDKKKMDSSKVRVHKSSSKKSEIVEDPNCGHFDVNSVQAFDDDDMELTIEDLMAIAEEYVKDYENKEQKEASTGHCESVKQFPVTSEFGNSLASHCEKKRSSTPAREELYSSTSIDSGELVTVGISQSGDPAQDMLNLLLGPLLKKPLEEEKNKSIIESVEFTHKSTRKNQEEFSGGGKVPLTKRKSSLKDKVVQFLD